MTYDSIEDYCFWSWVADYPDGSSEEAPTTVLEVLWTEFLFVLMLYAIKVIL